MMCVFKIGKVLNGSRTPTRQINAKICTAHVYNLGLWYFVERNATERNATSRGATPVAPPYFNTLFN